MEMMTRRKLCDALAASDPNITADECESLHQWGKKRLAELEAKGEEHCTTRQKIQLYTLRVTVPDVEAMPC